MADKLKIFPDENGHLPLVTVHSHLMADTPQVRPSGLSDSEIAARGFSSTITINGPITITGAFSTKTTSFAAPPMPDPVPSLAAPTRDAEQAVRSLRDHLEGLLEPSAEANGEDEDELLDAYTTAVRQNERARIRGIVEGMPTYVLEGTLHNGCVNKTDLLAALDAE